MCACACACACVCVSEYMPPYSSAHDEWLIIKLCMFVGNHDANNVSNFGGDPVTQLIFFKRFKNCLRCFTDTAHHSCDAATGFAAVATRSRAGSWSMEDRRRKSRINTGIRHNLFVQPASSSLIACPGRIPRQVERNTCHCCTT